MSLPIIWVRRGGPRPVRLAGPGRCPLKAEISGSNPLRATRSIAVQTSIVWSGLEIAPRDQIFRLIIGYRASQAVGAAVELSIPDRVADRARTAADGGGMSRFPRGRGYWSPAAPLRGPREGFVPGRENCRDDCEARPRTTYRRRSPIHDVGDGGGLEVVSAGHSADWVRR